MIGDLVLTDDGYYGIILGVSGTTSVVFHANGLTMEVASDSLTPLPMRAGDSKDTSANFIELVRKYNAPILPVVFE